MTISGQDRKLQLANRIEVALRTVLEVGLDCIVLTSILLLLAGQTMYSAIRTRWQEYRLGLRP
jgi:hypothetical protein